MTFRLRVARLPAQLLLMCLSRDTTRRPRLNRSLLLQTATSTRGLWLGRKFLQRFHRDTILERGLISGMQEDPRTTKVSVRAQRGTIPRGEKESRRETHLGTTGSSLPFAASIASFHLAVHRHHLQPGSRPIDLRLLPREALKSRNSLVRTPVERWISHSTG